MSATVTDLRICRVERRIGLAPLLAAAMRGLDLAPVINELLIAADNGPARGAALMDLSIIEQLKGNQEVGMRYQTLALEQCQIYESLNHADSDINLLVLSAPIRMGYNTPVELLLESSRVKQTTLFLCPERGLPDELPRHDLAFVAIPGDTDCTSRYLHYASECVINWPRPVLNHPASIRKLERDNLCRVIRNIPHVRVPDTFRVSRESLGGGGRKTGRDNKCWEGIDWPIVIRPVGSHAGFGLELLFDEFECDAYLAKHLDENFFISSFIDYRSKDGFFRKYRVVFVDGQPFPCHMAISDQWKIWYMNARMAESVQKKREECMFMENFNHDFSVRHGRAMDEIANRIELEYFGIDCAEDRDGNLVVFEADNSLIVHNMDPPEIFPYKSKHMKLVFAKFVEMLIAKADEALLCDGESGFDRFYIA